MSLSWDEALAATPEQLFEEGALAREYVVPPFTVLDTRQQAWLERRYRWLALGIQSELGRGGQLISHATTRTGYGADYDTANGENAWGGSGTSIFDPVLCELVYRWWCPAGGTVLDPFAGGSVRGIVAAMLGHPYTGIDLSAAQVEANREQARALLPPDRPMPRWYVGDSLEVLPQLPAGELYDLVFTCPPYYDLEVYSDDPADLSAMPDYATFADAYSRILGLAVHRLRPGRLAVVVVSDVRDKRGYYVGLPRDTELACEQAGAALYNDAVLVNAVGSLPIRTGRYMAASRKLGRMHQEVLCFATGVIDAHGWEAAREAPPTPQLALPLDQPAVGSPEEVAPPQPPTLTTAGTPPAELLESVLGVTLEQPPEPPTPDQVTEELVLEHVLRSARAQLAAGASRTRARDLAGVDLDLPVVTLGGLEVGQRVRSVTAYRAEEFTLRSTSQSGHASSDYRRAMGLEEGALDLYAYLWRDGEQVVGWYLLDMSVFRQLDLEGRPFRNPDGSSGLAYTYQQIEPAVVEVRWPPQLEPAQERLAAFVTPAVGESRQASLWGEP